MSTYIDQIRLPIGYKPELYIPKKTFYSLYFGKNLLIRAKL